jgi:membrane protease YdiL (CAAX protease family)
MDWRAATGVVVATLVLVVDEYRWLGHLFPSRAVERVSLFLIVPLLLVLAVFRRSPAEYGLHLGDWRAGSAFTAFSCAGLALVMVFVARTPAFQAFYGPDARIPFLEYAYTTGLTLLGWEFLFRGFLLFALLPSCGPLALVLQAVPFTIAHFGKPGLETLTCIFGGTAFGYVAWRTRSFLYPFLIHWFLTVFTVVAVGAISG